MTGFSDVLSDGCSTFTLGISEMGGSGSRYSLADAQGNSRGLLDGSQANTDGHHWDAFGNLVSRFGSNPTGYAWNEASGYQSDSGLKLLGNRYYDSRIGRFISQDPAGTGSNWYEYAGNNPANKVDPTGLYVGNPEPTTDQTTAHAQFAGAFYGDQAGLSSFFQQEDQSEVKDQLEYIASTEIQSAVISGPDGYASYVRGLLNEIAASPIGLSLLVDGYYSKKLDIQYYHDAGSPNSFYSPDTGILSYDPALHAQVMTSGGLSDAPPVSVLEHELGHDITGLLDPDAYPGCQTIFDTHMKDNIAVNENPFREYLGLPDRIDHQAFPMANGSFFDPSW